MRTLQTDQYHLTSTYGPAYRQGVLSEHLHLVAEAGGTIRPAASGTGVEWVVWADGTAYPVVCPELAWIYDEDGRHDGRCGEIATRDGACEGHAAESDEWRGMSEAERAAWERRIDEAESDRFYYSNGGAWWA